MDYVNTSTYCELHNICIDNLYRCAILGIDGTQAPHKDDPEKRQKEPTGKRSDTQGRPAARLRSKRTKCEAMGIWPSQR